MIRYKKYSFGVLMGGLILFSLSATSTVWAKGDFSTASLHGTYSYTNDNGNVGGYGIITFNGKGALEIAIKVNTPDEGGGRKVSSLMGDGTYTVAANGTGVATISFKGDSELTDDFEFVITQVDEAAGKMLATKVFAVKKAGGLKGQLVTPTWKRRPD